MKVEDIQKDERFKNYLERKSLQPNTIYSYTYHMKNYCDAISMTPSELLNEAFHEEEERLPMWDRKLTKHLEDFETYIKEKGYSKQHQQSSMTSIRNFYSYHDLQLPHPKPNRSEKNHETFEDLPDREDIKKALEHCNPKYKPIILSMISSGMGSAEVRNLKVKDFFDSISTYVKKPLKIPLDIDQIRSELKGKVVVPVFNIVRVKTKMPYTTFISPEATNAILDYLEQHPPDSEDNYLFSLANRNKNRQITDNTFTTYFRRLSRECNFGSVNGKAKFHSHALRKWFASTLMNKEIKEWSIQAMLGHTVKNRTRDAYLKPDPNQIKNDYLKIVDDLCILEDYEVKHLETDEYKQLKSLQRADRERKREMELLEETRIAQQEQIDLLYQKIAELSNTELVKEDDPSLNYPLKGKKDYDPGDEDDPL